MSSFLSARAGRAVGLCVTPMLPLDHTDRFIERLTAFAPEVLVTRDFHDSGGGFGADTGEAARRLLAGRRWTVEDYDRVVEMLLKRGRCIKGRRDSFRRPPDNC